MARDMGVPCIAVNVSVGLSLAIPGLSSDIARGIIKDLPFGTYSVAGIQSAEEARSSREVSLHCRVSVFLHQEILSTRPLTQITSVYFFLLHLHYDRPGTCKL